MSQSRAGSAVSDTKTAFVENSILGSEFMPMSAMSFRWFRRQSASYRNLGDDHLERHSYCNPMLNRVPAHIGHFNQFDYAIGSSSELHKYISTGVSLLLFSCSPSAIFRRVVLVVIDAINGMIRAWAVAYVGKKVPKGFSPSVTHFNSSGAIKAISLSMLIIAAIEHCFIGEPQWM